MRGGKRINLPWLAVVAVALVATALPATGSSPRTAGRELLAHVSQSVAARYYINHPDQAPRDARSQFEELRAYAASGSSGAASAGEPPVGLFNNDVFGLPQNEEAITVCSGAPNLVLGGTNDYRGLLNQLENFTGWHFSNDGGETLVNEGLLPEVRDQGLMRPSGGDPVFDCVSGSNNFYGGSLAYDPRDPFGQPNGIAVYLSNGTRLGTCDTSNEPFVANRACWPKSRFAAVSRPGHFLDKEWLDAGNTGDGVHVWVTYSDFDLIREAEEGCCFAEAFAVRCEADLSSCTAPILISGTDEDIQFTDVTIGPDGRTYVSWVQIFGEIEGTAQRFVMKMRVAERGSTTFGPTRVIREIRQPLPFGGFLHANDFRIASYPKNAVKMVNGKPRVFVVWDECASRPLASICEEAGIWLTYSDDLGASWSTPRLISAGAGAVGDNYFPTINDNIGGPGLVAAWFTNRFDPIFHNRQDVEMATINEKTGQVVRLRRLTSPSNESEADPLLGGVFIGDYIEATAIGGTAYVHFNANYRSVPLLGVLGAPGLPVPQQDNFLVKTQL